MPKKTEQPEVAETLESINPLPWYVIQTQGSHEVKVETALARRGFHTFLPRIPYPSRRRDRKIMLQAPLFPGYLFLQGELAPLSIHHVVKVKGVVRFLGNGSPAPLAEEVVSSIRSIVAGERPYYPHKYLEKGKWVRVADGPLAGVVGIIVEPKQKKRKVVIEVDLFRRAVAVELEDEVLEPWP